MRERFQARRRPLRALVRAIVPSTQQAQRYKDREDRRARIGAHLLALCTVLSGLGYLVWAVFERTPSHPVVTSVFLAAEGLCLTLFVVATMSVWELRYKPEEGLPVERTYDVDIFVPVCGEPLALLRATFDGVVAITWPGPLSVYVLDDGASDQVRSLASTYGFTYLSRARDGSRVNGKAGNLNFGLAQSTGSFVLVLDADQVPQPNILQALAGYMRFERVAFVQSKQTFHVPEGDPFFNQDRVFYEAVQLGCDSYDAAISCGSGVLYRRSALQDVGGFATWNLVEDLTSSYELHSRGWKSFYYPHEVSRGQAPSDVWGVYRQRGQWALDTMRLFFWDNPLIKRGLRWRQRMSYFVIPLSYGCAAFVFPFFFVIPLWSYLTGSSIFRSPEWQFLGVRGLYMAFMALALRLLFRNHQSGRQFQMLVGLFPVYMIAVFRALVYPSGRRPTYIPNNSVRAHRKPWPAALAVVPQLLLLLANMTLPFYALFAGTAPPRIIFANIFVSALAIWSLLPLVVAAFGRKVWSPQENPHDLYGVAPSVRS